LFQWADFGGFQSFTQPTTSSNTTSTEGWSDFTNFQSNTPKFQPQQQERIPDEEDDFPDFLNEEPSESFDAIQSLSPQTSPKSVTSNYSISFAETLSAPQQETKAQTQSDLNFLQQPETPKVVEDHVHLSEEEKKLESKMEEKVEVERKENENGELLKAIAKLKVEKENLEKLNQKMSVAQKERDVTIGDISLIISFLRLNFFL